MDLFFAYGAGIGVALTAGLFWLNKKMNVGKGGGGAYSIDLGGLVRVVVEGVLVCMFIAALVGTAILNTVPAWHMFLGYAGVRGIGLAFEYFYFSGRRSH